MKNILYLKAKIAALNTDYSITVYLGLASLKDKRKPYNENQGTSLSYMYIYISYNN